MRRSDGIIKKTPGLGFEFVGEVNKSLSRIVDYPHSCAEIESGIRRCLVSRFPYGIVYRQDEDEDFIVVIAITHLRRRPGYWRDRIIEGDVF